MNMSRTAAVAVLTLLALTHVLVAQDRSPTVSVVARGHGYTLLRNGEPCFIKGAGGAKHLDEAVAAGANSIREWGPDEAALEAARQEGLTVLLGLALGISRHGFDYHDAERVQKQLEQTVALVHRLKSNPAILMWALGNELELGATEDQRITTWKAVEQLARAVKREDPAHPVIAVLAGPGENKLRELDQYCPSLDGVGINTYSGIMTLPETIAEQGFDRPYIVTEFGPRGHWEVAKTSWGMPIEDTSTQKAEFIVKGYEHAIANRPQCLGSYVFLWGQKQEKTHTWYGLFLPDGAHLGGVDAMQFLWTGKWPVHRAPVIDGTVIAKAKGAGDASAGNVFPAGSQILCSIAARDLDADPITIKWDVRPDVANNPSNGGDFEPAAAPIAHSVEHQANQSAVIRLPETPGAYRIFVYVYNQHNGAATANLAVETK